MGKRLIVLGFAACVTVGAAALWLLHAPAPAQEVKTQPAPKSSFVDFSHWAVVLDPPRAGAEAQAKALAKSRVGTIAYVSCDAASFARDAALLVKGGYRMGPVTPVDQFLWSSHIELAAGFKRG